jgi:hypothetical protein
VSPAEREALAGLARIWIDDGAVGGLAKGVLELLAPAAGRLMVERVTAGARAVEAEEKLHRAEQAIRQTPQRPQDITRHMDAQTAFITAFQALDAAEIALRAVCPEDVDARRHHGQVAFILRERLDRLEKLTSDAPSWAAIEEAARVEGPMRAAGGTAWDVALAAQKKAMGNGR